MPSARRCTQRLVRDHGFNAVVVEADWPDAWRVNRYIRGYSDDANAEAALSGFERFPPGCGATPRCATSSSGCASTTAARPPRGRSASTAWTCTASMRSIRSVLQYLDRIDPEAAQRARSRYACFDHYGEDSQAYGYAASFGMKASCEDEVVQQLREMNRRAAELLAGSERGPRRRLLRPAERAPRAQRRGVLPRHVPRPGVVLEHAGQPHGGDAAGAGAPPAGAGRQARMAVWAHNSHLGDASATEMGDLGEWNVGQLARDRWGDEAVLVGFSTARGTVTAASAWDARRSASACARACRAATRTCSTSRRGALLAAAARQRGAGGAADRTSGCSGRSG
jgi:erythromycin esterase-like protein